MAAGMPSTVAIAAPSSCEHCLRRRSRRSSALCVLPSALPSPGLPLLLGRMKLVAAAAGGAGTACEVLTPGV